MVLALALPVGARAETYAVDRTDDPPGPIPTPCTPAPNDCSIRQAAQKAGADPGTDLITLGPGQFHLTDVVYLDEAVDVVGAGARQSIVRTDGEDLFFTDSEEPTYEFADLTLTGARNTGPAYGGAIHASSPLILRRVAIVDNWDGAHTETVQLYPAWGGAVYATAGLTVIDSLIARNTASTEDNGTEAIGGGLRLYGKDNLIRNSTIVDNVASGYPSKPARGGGISVASGASLTLENVTLARNEASGGASSRGSDLSIDPGATVTARNSIIANGIPSAVGNCDRPVVTGGGNVDDGFECGLSGSDRRGADPFLAPLANNGGPTDTAALLAGSPAFDFGGYCGLEADQRGLPRLLGACDSGAYEVQPVLADCAVKVLGNLTSLRARVTCSEAATLSIGGNAVIRPKKRKHRRRHAHRAAADSRRKKAKALKVGLPPVTGAAGVGTPVELALRLPRKARGAVRAGRRVSLSITLSARTGTGGQSSATARLAKIGKPVRKKRKHS